MFLSFQFSGWKLSLHFDPSFALPGRFPDRCCFLYLPLLSIIVAISRSLKGWYGRHRDRSWCSQISTRGPGMLNTQACSVREGMHRPVIHPEDGQQMWLIALWPICVAESTLEMAPPTPIVSLSIYRTCLYGPCCVWSVCRARLYGKCLYKQFPGSHVFRFIVHTGFNYHWETFHQIVLRLNMPKINYLGLDPEDETNTGYWVVEPSYLLASHRLILCWP
jgi:hypothetical protein